jgi:hypothetical protein
MNIPLFLKCQSQIGLQGAIAILNSESFVMEKSGWVLFNLNENDCAWAIDSNPPLLVNQSTDRRHTNYQTLRMETVIYQAN